MKHAHYLPRCFLLAVAMLWMPAAIQAQFAFTTNNGAITITGYNDAGGTVVIPDSTNGYPVTSIGSQAFYQKTNITNVTIPDSVTVIGVQAFSTCTNLQSVVIGVGVTNIMDSAFSYCSKMTNIIIPNGVIELGKSSFFQCSSLSSVIFGTSVTKIGDAAFEYSRVRNLTIPDNVRSIGNYAFANCFNLGGVSIGNGVKSIGIYAFADSGLTSVSIGNSVTNIGDYAFLNSGGLSSVIIPDSVITIGNSAFYNSINLASVTIGTNVTGIGISAFQGCSYLTSLVIPNSVKGIGSQAFYGCTFLASLSIGDHVTYIGNYAFNGCSFLSNVTIPTNVITIGNYAFNNCGLVSAALNCPNVGDYLFEFTGLASVTLGRFVTNIGNYTFYLCNYLNTIDADASNPVFSSVDGVLFNKTQTTLIKFPNGRGGSYSIPNSVTKIGDYAFYDCSGLTNVLIPNTVTNIGNVAFANTGLRNVTIPDSVRFIGTNAFASCSSLTNATIGSGLTSIGSTPFANCPNLIMSPYVVTRATSATNFIGANATFSVTALASPAPSYRWRRGNADLFNGGNISGVTSASMTVSNLSIGDAGTYSVVISNSVGSVTSLVVTLTVVINQQLVQNSGFESGGANWTVSGNLSAIFLTTVNPVYIHSGTIGLVAGPTNSLTSLLQTLPTIPGNTYLLSFWLNNPSPGTPNQFVVKWNGTTIYNQSNLPAFGWTNMQFTVSATASSTVLSFGFRHDPGYFGLDDVTVSPVVSPSPVILGLSLSGTNLVINGANGVSGGSYTVLMSTNLALPLIQWTPVSTNLVGANGIFTFTATNAVKANSSQQFYILQKQ